MSKILTLGNNGEYSIINPDESRINEYISKTGSSTNFQNNIYWEDLLNFLKSGEKGIHASKFIPFGIGHDVIINPPSCESKWDIFSFVNGFFNETQKYSNNRADFVLVQDLIMKDLNSFIKNPTLSGKTQLLLYQ